MSYRNNHISPVWGLIGIVVVLVVVIGVGYFGLQSQKIEAEKQEHITQIEEHEATERTEERSQFFQKLVPWGENEEEKDDNESI